MILFTDMPIKNNTLNENAINHDEQVLNEQYFGKTDNLKKIDKCFDKIIELAKGNTDYGITRYNQSYEKTFYKESSKIVLDISKYVEDEFNLKSAGIIIYNSASVNAITLKNRNNMKKPSTISKGTQVTKNGVKFKDKDKGISILLSRELFDIDGLEGKHFTAILLHEIGHQLYFENTFRYKFRATEFIDTTLDLILLNSIDANVISQILLSNIVINKVIFSDKALNRYASSNKMYNKIDDGSIKKIIGSFTNIIDAISSTRYLYDTINGIIKMVSLPIRSFRTMAKKTVNTIIGDTGYTEEQFCDNFATAYGYGPEIIKALAYIESNSGSNFKKVMEKNILSSTIYNSINDLDFMIFGSNDCHPSTIARIIDQIKFIEIQLENEKDHPLYTEIKHDLQSMKNQYEQILVKLSKFEKNSDSITKGKVFAAIGHSLQQLTKGGLQYNMSNKAYDNSGNLKALKR